MSDPVIRIAALHKSYGFYHPKTVLKGVDLEVPPGVVMGLMGTNGEGKSTLIKCMLGLLKRTAGEIRVFGEDPWDLSAEAKGRIGYVPQEPALLPWLTLRQSMHYTAAFFATWDDAHAHALVKQLGVPLDERLGTLSLGQKQKGAIVLAMGHRPELLVLDEPVASLDPLARRKFLESLVAITEEEGHTVLFSTHIGADLERVASHVAILQGGRTLFCDELDVLKDRMKRVRILAPRELPSSFAVTGALRTQVQGRTALVAVPLVDEVLLEDLRTRWEAEVSVEDLNLEEIFVEMADA